MNDQALVHPPPLYAPEYSQLPTDQSCITEHIGHPAANQDSFAAGEGADHRRDGVLGLQHSLISTNAGQLRYMAQRLGPHDNSQYGHGSGISSESGSGSLSTSPSSSGSDLLSPLNSGTTHNPFPTSQILSSVGGYPPPYRALSTGVSRMPIMADPPGPGMLNHAPSRSPAGNNPGSPSIRDNYTTSTPHLGRHALSPRTNVDVRSTYPSMADTPRSVNSYAAFAPNTTAQYGSHSTMFQQPYQPPVGPEGQDSPPFGPQENFDKEYTILDQTGHRVSPSIHAKIEKGFFLAPQNVWTCYRRNYFSVQCSYSFDIYTPNGAYFVQRPKHEDVQIQAMAMSLSAVVDGSGGKAIELIQHTPKRDKGPQNPVHKEKLVPVPPGKQHPDPRSFTPMSSYTQTSSYPPPHFPLQADDGGTPPGGSHGSHAPSSQSHQAHTFERIQFKQATANNGKRRAQQQYYHLIVELWVDLRKRHDAPPDWHKVAQRESEQVVVRGRSPSHYQAENNAGGTSRGGAGAGGGAGPGAFGSSGVRYAGSSLGGSLPLANATGMSSNYRSHQFSLDPGPLGSNPASASSSISSGTMDVMMKEEDSKPTDGHFEGYSYYPGPLYDSSGLAPSKHPNAAPAPPDDLRRIKEEHGAGGPHTIPPMWPGRCGPFQATETSRGHYPFPDYNTAGY